MVFQINEIGIFIKAVLLGWKLKATFRELPTVVIIAIIS